MFDRVLNTPLDFVVVLSVTIFNLVAEQSCTEWIQLIEKSRATSFQWNCEWVFLVHLLHAANSKEYDKDKGNALVQNSVKCRKKIKFWFFMINK